MAGPTQPGRGPRPGPQCRPPRAARPRGARRHERRGTAHLFLSCEPLVGHRHVAVTEQRTAVDFAKVVHDLREVRYPHAEKGVLVMDNLNTHKPRQLCHIRPEPALARPHRTAEIHSTLPKRQWAE
ncbi:MAG: transposase [Candidatus Competibacteraceae bacterium]|nr:transposase [Candidatus Competibacteraceae bacterium]